VRQLVADAFLQLVLCNSRRLHGAEWVISTEKGPHPIRLPQAQEDRAELAAEVKRLQVLQQEQAAELQQFADSDPEVRLAGCLVGWLV